MAVVVDKMLDLFSSYGQPYLEAFPDEIFKSNKALWFVSKLSAYKQGKKIEQTKGRGDTIVLASAFQKMKGRSVEISYDTSEFLTETQLTNGSLYITDREKRELHEGGSTVFGKHFAADVGLGMSVPLQEMQRWEELRKGREHVAMQLKWTEKWKGFLQRFATFIAREWYWGRGCVETENGYDPFNSRVVSTFSKTKPIKNELEGIMYYLMDPTYDYGGLDVSTYGYFAPYSYRLDLADTTPVFGYDTTTEFDSRSELIGTTNSMTASVPIILDIISQAITDMNAGNSDKVELIVVSKNLYNTIKDAKKSKLYTQNGGGDGAYLEKLMAAGIDDALVIDGVAVIMDDTTIKSPTSKTGTYIFPENKILLYKKLDSFKFFMNELNSFAATPFKEIPNVWNTFETHVSGTLLSVNTYRAGQGMITLPTIDYSA